MNLTLTHTQAALVLDALNLLETQMCARYGSAGPGEQKALVPQFIDVRAVASAIVFLQRHPAPPTDAALMAAIGPCGK